MSTVLRLTAYSLNPIARFTRCGKASFMNEVMAQLEEHEAAADRAGGGGSGGRAGGSAAAGSTGTRAVWTAHTIDAPERTFDFRGRDVPQPSVIQVWSRHMQS